MAQLSIKKAPVSGRTLDIVLVLTLFLGALAIRLPNIMTIPSFTDETVEVLQSLKILKGTVLLTNADPYYGAVYNYLVAGVFYLFGPSAENARLMVTAFGSLTVAFTYLLGKVIENRLTGLVIALMMLTSGALIVNGHIAWENELTPLFSTSTFLVLAIALKKGNGVLLILSGLLYGLTLQTHPGLIILGIGLGFYFVVSALFPRYSGVKRSLKGWLKSPWPYLTLLAALLGYGDVIAQSIIQPFSSWNAAQRHDYAFVTSPTFDTYFTDIQNFGVMVLRMVSSNFDNKPTPLESLQQPLNLLYLGLLVVGIIYAIKRGKLLPVVVLFTASLLLPYFNKSYGYPGAARYVGYLFPLLYLLVATPLIELARSTTQDHRLRASYTWLLLIFLIVAPAFALSGYFTGTQRSGNTNERVLAIHDILRHQYISGAVSEIIIDDQLNQQTLGGGGNVLRTLDYLFTLENTPHRTLKVTPDTIKNELKRSPAKPLAFALTTDNYQSLSSQLQMTVMDAKGSSSANKYGAYLVEGALSVSK